MNSETNIETKLKEFREYLLAEIDRLESELDNYEHPDGEYEKGALNAFMDIEKRLYDRILHELTYENN